MGGWYPKKALRFFCCGCGGLQHIGDALAAMVVSCSSVEFFNRGNSELLIGFTS